MRQMITRRRFLEWSFLGGAGIATAGCDRTPPASAVAVDAGVPAFEFDEATIAGLLEGMKSDKLSARTIVEKYLARIEAIDRQGPRLNSIIEVNPEALAIADE